MAGNFTKSPKTEGMDAKGAEGEENIPNEQDKQDGVVNAHPHQEIPPQTSESRDVDQRMEAATPATPVERKPRLH
jgi:hypothetical protein